MPITKDDKLRFGVSALDLTHKDRAQKDEILVDGTVGKLFYKREDDGQIVSFDALDYEKSALSTALRPMMGASSFKSVDTDFIVYYTANIAGKSELLTSKVTDVGLSDYRLNLSANESGFFIRVRGTNTTNAVASFLETIYKDTAVKNAVSIIFTITEHGANDHVRKISVSCKYNELTLVPLSAVDGDAKDFDISIDSVAYPWLHNAYASLSDEQKADLQKLNFENAKFESDTIDIVTFSTLTDASNLVAYNAAASVKLNMIIPVETMVESFRGGSAYDDDASLVISKDEPDHPCLWRKIMD